MEAKVLILADGSGSMTFTGPMTHGRCIGDKDAEIVALRAELEKASLALAVRSYNATLDMAKSAGLIGDLAVAEERLYGAQNYISDLEAKLDVVAGQRDALANEVLFFCEKLALAIQQREQLRGLVRGFTQENSVLRAELRRTSNPWLISLN